jgi:putative transposase
MNGNGIAGNMGISGASNYQAQPFVWTATADSIFAKVQRLCERISGTGH